MIKHSVLLHLLSPGFCTFASCIFRTGSASEVLEEEEEEAMGKAKKTRKFAQVKRMITPKAIKQSVLQPHPSAPFLTDVVSRNCHMKIIIHEELLSP